MGLCLHTLNSGWGYVSAPLPGWEGEGLFQASLNLPNRLSGWEGLGATLSLGYELIPLPEHNMETLHAPEQLCSRERSALLAHLLAWVPLGHTASRSCLHPFWPDGVEVDGTVIQLLVWAYVNWALGLAKLLIWGSKLGKSAPHWVPRSECTPDLVLQMSKATGWDYYLGTAGMNLVCQDRVLVVASPSPLLHHSQIPSCWAPQIPLQSLWYKIRVGTPIKWPTMLEAVLFVPLGSLFPLEELGA